MKITDFYSKEFSCGRTTISRNLFETLTNPYNTENVSDKAMQDIAEEVEKEMKDFYKWEEEGLLATVLLQKKWWSILESVIRKHNIPHYYE